MGRLLGRTGWRLARQLPGARTLELEAQRLQTRAARQARRVLQVPATRPMTTVAPTTVEQNAIDYVQNPRGGDPLRSAMSELLDRSIEASRTDSREYLYGTIISQLVPDEARILAALSDGSTYAAVDVVQKLRRGRTRTLLANASPVGRQAGLVTPDNTPTYLGRLHNFGLIELRPADPELSAQYDVLAGDAAVRRAREEAGSGSTRLERKTVAMSAFGREFWNASDPARPNLS